MCLKTLGKISINNWPVIRETVFNPGPNSGQLNFGNSFLPKKIIIFVNGLKLCKSVQHFFLSKNNVQIYEFLVNWAYPLIQGYNQCKMTSLWQPLTSESSADDVSAGCSTFPPILIPVGRPRTKTADFPTTAVESLEGRGTPVLATIVDGCDWLRRRNRFETGLTGLMPPV